MEEQMPWFGLAHNQAFAKGVGLKANVKSENV